MNIKKILFLLLVPSLFAYCSRQALPSLEKEVSTNSRVVAWADTVSNQDEGQRQDSTNPDHIIKLIHIRDEGNFTDSLNHFDDFSCYSSPITYREKWELWEKYSDWEVIGGHTGTDTCIHDWIYAEDEDVNPIDIVDCLNIPIPQMENKEARICRICLRNEERIRSYGYKKLYESDYKKLVKQLPPCKHVRTRKNGIGPDVCIDCKKMHAHGLFWID